MQIGKLLWPQNSPLGKRSAFVSRSLTQCIACCVLGCDFIESLRTLHLERSEYLENLASVALSFLALNATKR